MFNIEDFSILSVFKKLKAKYYFKRGNIEIDFLLSTNNSIIPIEIKVDVTDSELKNFYL